MTVFATTDVLIGRQMLTTGIEVGVYKSAEAPEIVWLLRPPATSTSPFCKRDATWSSRTLFMLPVEANVPEPGVYHLGARLWCGRTIARETASAGYKNSAIGHHGRGVSSPRDGKIARVCEAAARWRVDFPPCWWRAMKW